MKTTSPSAQRTSSENRLFAQQRTTIRRLIELQPEYFQRDAAPALDTAKAGRVGAVIAFPLAPRTPTLIGA